MTRPAVTVLIDTYNHERFIEEAIVSVLEQDFPRAEVDILVVDDGSTDRTPEIVRKFQPHVRILRKTNGGQGSAFNAGIPETRGEIVAFLDGDDWWAKAKLSVVMDYLACRPHIGILGHGIYEIDSDTGETNTTTPQHAREIRFDTVDGGRFFRQMMCFFGTSRVTMRRSVLSRVLPVPESLVVEADEFISIMSAAHSAAGLLQQPLTFYRLHANNLFQVRRKDEVKLRQIQMVLAALARELRIRLGSTTVAPEIIEAIVEPLDVGSKRLRLTLDGGSRWETFHTERAEFRIAYKKGSPAYRAFKSFVLACTLALSPKSFYRLRDWYSRSNWRRVRSILGEPVPNAEIRNVLTAAARDSQNERAPETSEATKVSQTRS
jgi:glycosyltransferase involved in cell wall biosynthesis